MIAWETVLAVAGGIVLLGNAGAAINRWLSPALQVKRDVEETHQRVDELEEHGRNDFVAIKELQQMNKLQCQAMLCMINHMIDGNGVANMKKTREEIQELLIKM